MFRRLGIALGLLALTGVSIRRVVHPPPPVPATAPDTMFSAQRAMRHVREIARRPHPMGAPDHDRVRDYIVTEFVRLGLTPTIQDATGIGTRYRSAGRVQNILVRLRGSDASTEALLLVAHYDGVPASPAAADDGAGCAALLETIRALRARHHPLEHDVIVLFTDGEEAGLLGAAAFAREHPWARDVDMVLNFEARGTGGRSLMFETGPGNLDAARLLGAAGNATAGSVFTAIYRMLPNDTDLSELAILGVPALNFAFTDGVERYHTSRDDVAHLDPGSVQHHGDQMLALASLIGNGPLPRPTTGDAVFFDLPLLGLIVYPVTWSLPLASLAALLVVIVVVRTVRTGGDRIGVLLGVMMTVVMLLVAAIIGAVGGSLVRGPGAWSGAFAGAVVAFALAATLACRAAVRRWIGPGAWHLGALIVWMILALVLSVRAPDAAYLFYWPLLLAASAALLTRGSSIANWIVAAGTLFLLGGLIYMVSAVLLGVAAPGAIVAAVMTSLIAALLVPLDTVDGETARWDAVAWIAAIGIGFVLFGVATVRPGADHPTRSALVYAERVGGGVDPDLARQQADAWLGTTTDDIGARGPDGVWARAVLAPATPTPVWTHRITGPYNRFVGRRVAAAALLPPDAVLVADTTVAGERRVEIRVTAPRGTTDLMIRVNGARVSASSIDGRAVETSRDRIPSDAWVMQYAAVPDSGAMVGLAVPRGGTFDVELAAWSPGIPPVADVHIPARPPGVVASQSGDAHVVYRTIRF